MAASAFHTQVITNRSPEKEPQYGDYMEHVFYKDELLATIYQLVNGRYKFSCRYILWNETEYRNLQTARLELAVLIERNIGVRADVLWEKKNH